MESMKTYWILYWCGLYKTETFVKANSEIEATAKFRALKGNNAQIIKVEEVEKAW